MLKMRMLGIAAAGAGLLASGGLVRAQQAAPATRAPQPNAAQTRQAARELGEMEGLPGPIDSPRDVRDTLKAVFIAADTNNDGQLSQQEVVDAANLVVGGFFFRADADGDGVLTPEEARASREKVLQRSPILRVLVQEVRRQQGGQQGETAQQSPYQGLADLIDSNNDRQVQAAEVRQSVQTAVESVFAAADTNRDGQMSPSEINAAAIGIARAGVQAAFAAADTDNSGAVSREEFEKAIVEPARVVFGAIDADNDGQITPEEAQRARQVVRSQLRVQVPESRGEAPIPNFNLGAATQPGQGQAQPAQPAAPRAAPPR